MYPDIVLRRGNNPSIKESAPESMFVVVMRVNVTECYRMFPQIRVISWITLENIKDYESILRLEKAEVMTLRIFSVDKENWEYSSFCSSYLRNGRWKRRGASTALFLFTLTARVPEPSLSMTKTNDFLMIQSTTYRTKSLRLVTRRDL